MEILGHVNYGADSYLKAVQEQANMDRILNFLLTCEQSDICRLFDSSAFNEIAKSYLRIAVKELTNEGTIDEEQARAVRNRFSLLFDEKSASEVYLIDC